MFESVPGQCASEKRFIDSTLAKLTGALPASEVIECPYINSNGQACQWTGDDGFRSSSSGENSGCLVAQATIEQFNEADASLRSALDNLRQTE